MMLSTELTHNSAGWTLAFSRLGDAAQLWSLCSTCLFFLLLRPDAKVIFSWRRQSPKRANRTKEPLGLRLGTVTLPILSHSVV